MRTRLMLLSMLALGAFGCGSASPEAEATWETHTTAEDESAGDEASDEPNDGSSAALE